MTHNVGKTDRNIRLVLGVLLIALGLTHVLTGGISVVAYAAGAIALVTGAFNFCPAWVLLGINTCTLKRGQAK